MVASGEFLSAHSLNLAPLLASFAPAWQSIVFNDHHSTLYIDADLGRLILRIDQQLISISLSRVERLIVDQDDFYIECSQ